MSAIICKCGQSHAQPEHGQLRQLLARVPPAQHAEEGSGDGEVAVVRDFPPGMRVQEAKRRNFLPVAVFQEAGETMPTLSRRVLLFSVPALAAGSAFAQFKRVEGAKPASSEPDATFRVDVNVVNILATVRDKDGHIVGNLNKDDFEIVDNGHTREIQYFSQQSDLPLTIGLLVDTSFSQRDILDDERKASYAFLNEVLRAEQDHAFLIKFDAEVELVQDLTASKPLLEKGLASLRTPQPSFQRPFQTPAGNQFQIGVGIPLPGGRRRRPGGGRSGGGRGGGSGGGRGIPQGIGTLLYDAVYLAGDEVLAKQPGRKAILLLSDGVDFGSKVTESAAVEAAHRADTLVYSILYADEDGPGQGRGGARMGRILGDGKKVLEKLSSQTGAGMFEVSSKNTLSAIFNQIQEELRNQYSLGFTPGAESGPAFRTLEVRTKNKNLKVQTRSGYYPKPA